MCCPTSRDRRWPKTAFHAPATLVLAVGATPWLSTIVPWRGRQRGARVCHASNDPGASMCGCRPRGRAVSPTTPQAPFIAGALATLAAAPTHGALNPMHAPRRSADGRVCCATCRRPRPGGQLRRGRQVAQPLRLGWSLPAQLLALPWLPPACCHRLCEAACVGGPCVR